MKIKKIRYYIVLERVQGPTLLDCNYADTCFTVALGSVLAGWYAHVPHRSLLYQQCVPAQRICQSVNVICCAMVLFHQEVSHVRMHDFSTRSERTLSVILQLNGKPQLQVVHHPIFPGYRLLFRHSRSVFRSEYFLHCPFFTVPTGHHQHSNAYLVPTFTSYSSASSRRTGNFEPLASTLALCENQSGPNRVLKAPFAESVPPAFARCSSSQDISFCKQCP